MQRRAVPDKHNAQVASGHILLQSIDLRSELALGPSPAHRQPGRRMAGHRRPAGLPGRVHADRREAAEQDNGMIDPHARPQIRRQFLPFEQGTALEAGQRVCQFCGKARLKTVNEALSYVAPHAGSSILCSMAGYTYKALSLNKRLRIWTR